MGLTGSILGISWDFSGDFMRFEWWFHGIKVVIVHQKTWILSDVFQYLMYMFISQVDAHHLVFCVGLMNGEYNELVRGWNSPCIWVYMSGLVPQRYLKQLGQMDVYSQRKQSHSCQPIHIRGYLWVIVTKNVDLKLIHGFVRVYGS